MKRISTILLVICSLLMCIFVSTQRVNAATDFVVVNVSENSVCVGNTTFSSVYLYDSDRRTVYFNMDGTKQVMHSDYGLDPVLLTNGSIVYYIINKYDYGSVHSTKSTVYMMDLYTEDVKKLFSYSSEMGILGLSGYYEGKIYYVKELDPGFLCCYDINTGKNSVLLENTTGTVQYDNYFLCTPYEGGGGPLDLTSYDVLTGKTNIITKKMMGHEVLDGKLYYVDYVKNYNSNTYFEEISDYICNVIRCDLDGGNKQIVLKGKRIKGGIDELTSTYITYTEYNYENNTTKEYKYEYLKDDEIVDGDGKKTFYAMVLNGIGDDASFGTDNNSAMIYDRLVKNGLSGYEINKNNIHPFSYNNDNSPMSKADLNYRISYSFKDTDGDDLSIFYYAGHSSWDGKSASNYGITLGGIDGYYRWADLASYLADNVKGEIVVIMDSCFSGYFEKNGIESLKEVDKKRFSVLSSCSSEEESTYYSVAWNIFYGNLPYGCFTYYLGEGIGFVDNRLHADANSDYKVTLGELYDYTSKKVTAKKYNMTVGLYASNRNKVIFEYQPSIKLNKKTLTLKKGKTYKLKATTKNAYGKVIWKSKNPKIATVSSTGKIKGKKKGSTKITATINGKTVSCKIQVN